MIRSLRAFTRSSKQRTCHFRISDFSLILSVFIIGPRSLAATALPEVEIIAGPKTKLFPRVVLYPEPGLAVGSALDLIVRGRPRGRSLIVGVLPGFPEA